MATGSTSDSAPPFLSAEVIPYVYEKLRGKDVEPPASNIIPCSDPIGDEYLEFVARTGRPLLDWSILKSLIVWKLERVMLEISQCGPFDHLPGVPNTDRSSSRQYMERILSASRSLTGVPFTIQRICELLTQPKKHYKRADKFYRALEKNITVVTTVDGEGRRETERQPPEDESIADTNLKTPEPETTRTNCISTTTTVEKPPDESGGDDQLVTDNSAATAAAADSAQTNSNVISSSTENPTENHTPQ